MEVSIFLAKAFGLYLVIVGLSVLKEGNNMMVIAKELINNESYKYITGMITLILGIILVISHNIWVGGYEVVITILAWLTLFKGLTRFFLSKEKFDSWAEYWISKNTLTISGVVSLVVGLYLSYIGFFI